MNHVSVSPTNGNGPTQGQEKNSNQGGNWTDDLRVRSPPLYRLSYKVRREQAVGTEDVKVTAMNMYKYKEGFPLYKRNLSLYLYMLIAVTLTCSVPTACSRLTL